MRGPDEAAIVSDAYIDSLLAAHRRLPVALPDADFLPSPELRAAAELLAGGLPRFHPSFLFEEQLAAQLRQAGMGEPGMASPPATVPGSGPLVISLPHVALPQLAVAGRVDRRVLIGGAAIASGVSVAAVYAWRQTARRGRARDVTA